MSKKFQEKNFLSKTSNGVKNIIPAILTNDINDLKDKLDKVRGLCDWIQIDIMDGIFVNNISVSLKHVLFASKNFNVEAHLMVEKPETYLPDAKQAHIKRVIFHYEAVDDVMRIIEKIKEYGFEAGIAINPDTPLDRIIPYKDSVDLILFLGVKPGFGGQEFETSVIDKIKQLHSLDKNIKIEVDGGVSLENISALHVAGANYFVIGTDLFSALDIRVRLKQLQQKLI